MERRAAHDVRVPASAPVAGGGGPWKWREAPGRQPRHLSLRPEAAPRRPIQVLGRYLDGTSPPIAQLMPAAPQVPV